MQQNAGLFPLTYTRDEAGAVNVGGCSLTQLADQWKTPLYLLDGITVRAHAARLIELGKLCYPGKFTVAYASKAYLSLKFAQKLSAMPLGIDTVSLGEMMIARKAGIDGKRVHLHGNGKTEEELRYALDWGVDAIVVDSLEEMEYLASLAEEKSQRAAIWLRITPGVDVDTHAHVQTGQTGSKFGVSIHGGQAALVIKQALRHPWLDLTGLHIHLGSQIFDPAPYQKAVRKLIQLSEECGFKPRQISTGGGWGVRYVGEQADNDAETWIKAVSDTLSYECRQRDWEYPELVLEPGRWLIARAGVALYKVTTSKFNGEGKYVIALDGGMADNPRPAMYSAVYTADLAARKMPDEKLDSMLVGKFCESGDILIHSIQMPEVKRGELIAIPVAGAYQISMASNYNMASRPAVLWLEDDNAEVLQYREDASMSDYWLGKTQETEN